MADSVSNNISLGLVEQMQDGKVVSEKKSTDNVTSETGSTTATNQSQTEKTKQMFLKILVAEMQYQDPTNPTDNTEYVKEMASLSQVESLQNMQSSIEESTSNAMAGKYVTVTDDDGNTVEGKVEYVTTVDNVKKVSIDGKLYDADNISSVYDESYYEDTQIASAFDALFAKLPSEANVTDSDKDLISNVSKVYDNLSDNQKNLLKSANVENVLKALKKKVNLT
jgi:flagellar basal-body rod modification protein FlgD